MQNNPIVVVTGAAGGIGSKICEVFARRGGKVWALDRNPEALLKLAQALGAGGHSLHTSVTDITDRASLRTTRDKIYKEYGRIDVWINNAGLPGIGHFLELSEDDFHRVVRVNFEAVVTGTRLALEVMAAQKSGTIVNMASVAGHIPAPYMTAYASTKHAVVGFTRALEEELRLNGSPVRTVMVSPGFVNTPLLGNEGRKLRFPEWLRWTLGTPEAVAKSIERAVRHRRREIFPTWNGRFMMACHRVAPRFTVFFSRILLTSSAYNFIIHRIDNRSLSR